MNEINFLPARYRAEGVRRRRAYRYAALLVVAGMCMSGWYYYERRKLTNLEDYLAVVKDESAAARVQNNERFRLTQQAKQLAQQLQINRELIEPIAQTTVIAILSQLTPESIAMVNLSMVHARRPITKPGDKPPVKENESSLEKALDPWQYIEVSLEGFAPSGVEIANLVGVLEEHPLFEKIRMIENQPTSVEDLIARQFQIRLRVPLDRDYQLRPQKAAADRPPVGSETAYVN